MDVFPGFLHGRSSVTISRAALVLVVIGWLAVPAVAPAADVPMRAAWMQGNWGIRVVLPSGDVPEVTEFDVDAFVRPLVGLKTPRWVMLNVTAGSSGATYTTVMPDLDEAVDPRMAPTRDLLGEVIQRLDALDYKVLVYFATQGPRNERSIRNLSRNPRRKAEQEELEDIQRAWNGALKKRKLDNFQGVVELCIKPVSRRFGDRIDGWWFDHGVMGDPDIYIPAARAGNPGAAVAWNADHGRGKTFAGENSEGGKVFTWLPARSNGMEDYTAGHITPTDVRPPSWEGNEEAIAVLEREPIIDGVVGHVFIPLQTHWRRGDPVFPDGQLVDWTWRVVNAGAAITWAAALTPPEFRYSTIDERIAEQLQRLDAALVAKGHPTFR